MKSRKVREQEAREPVLAQLRGLVSTLQGATEQMAATVSSSVRAEVQHQLHVAVGRCVGRVLGKVVGLERATPDSLLHLPHFPLQPAGVHFSTGTAHC